MIIKLQQNLNAFEKESLYPHNITLMITLQFATKSHPPDIPKNKISFCEERLHKSKTQKRGSSKAMANVIVLRSFQILLGAGDKECEEILILIDRDALDGVGYLKMSKNIFNSLLNQPILFAISLFSHFLIHHPNN